MNFANFKILQNLPRPTTENNSIRMLTIGGKFVISNLQDVQLPIGPLKYDTIMHLITSTDL